MDARRMDILHERQQRIAEHQYAAEQQRMEEEQAEMSFEEELWRMLDCNAKKLDVVLKQQAALGKDMKKQKEQMQEILRSLDFIYAKLDQKRAL